MGSKKDNDYNNDKLESVNVKISASSKHPNYLK